VKYTIPHDTEALIFVKYGDGQIPGSPFPVRPAHENGGGKEYNDRIWEMMGREETFKGLYKFRK